MKSYGGWILVAALLSWSGCALTPTFATGYRVEPMPPAARPAGGSLAVLQFGDQRPPQHYSTQGKLFILYVPIVPYVTIDFERLDQIVPKLSAGIRPGDNVYGAIQNRAPEQSTYAYPVSMAKAVAEDLATRDLFDSVEYVGEGSGEGHDYIMSGVLRATPVRTTTTSYCLGMAGVLLWLVPMPMQKTTGATKLDLTLTKTATNEVVWSHTVEAEVSRLDNLYTTNDGILYGTSAFSYQMATPPKDSQVDRTSIFAWNFEALRRGMAAAEPSLAAALPAK
jgi:hypothetical protein